MGKAAGGAKRAHNKLKRSDEVDKRKPNSDDKFERKVEKFVEKVIFKFISIFYFFHEFIFFIGAAN